MSDTTGATASKNSKDDRTFGEKVNDYLVNDGPKIVFVILWLLANAAVIIDKYYFYTVKKPELFALLGHGLTGARCAATAIKLNSALLFGTVLRNFLSWIRGSFLGTYLPIDKNIIFHRYIAWSIAVYAFVHTIAHYFNFLNLSRATNEQVAILGFQTPPSPSTLAFLTLPGITGHVVSLVMTLMYSSAIRYIRSPMFNVFWFTHHLFIFFVGILCFHGASQFLKEAPNYWQWVVGPFFLYAVERTLRIMRGNQDTILQLAIAHPSKVLELQLKKSTFKYKPGQYLFLNCPYIASQEWHPFTITSAPEEDYVSVHIRIVGDWTGDLWAFLNPNKKLGVVQENLLSAPDGSPIFRIDGPYGAASEDTFKFNTVMLIGGGIGVTPFASILKSIRYKLEQTGQTTISKAYFYWICRDKNSFEWFSDLLAALEQNNINNFLEINTYLTAPMSVDEIRNVMHGVDAEADQITGLQSPTHFGRPNWNQIFEERAKIHNGQDVGVFFCGPAVLSKQLYKYCRKFTDSKTKTKFMYHKENF